MFNFPWSNFHELNLDWILSVVKEAKEIFIKGEGDIQHAVETADQALETAEQAAAGVIADGAVTIPKINSEVFGLLAYCVSGSVAPNFIPAGALVILRKSTIYNVTDGIYTATRNIPQAAIITAADLDQSATLYREGGMNYLLHNMETLSGTIDLIKAGLVILVTGDEASAAVPADGLVYVANNTHGLTEGFYFNSSGAIFPPTGGTADADSFTAVNNILNALQTAIATLGSDDIANDSTVAGVSVTDALDAVKNSLTKMIPILPGSTNILGYTLNIGDYFESGGVLYKVTTAIPNGEAWAGKATVLSTTALNDLRYSLSEVENQVQLLVVSDTDTAMIRNLAQSVDNFKLITIEFLNSVGALFSSIVIPTAVFKTHSGGNTPIVLYVYDGSGFQTAYVRYISETTVYAAVGASGYALTIRGIK